MLSLKTFSKVISRSIVSTNTGNVWKSGRMSINLLKKRYGTEPSDMAIYAHEGKFPEVDPDYVDNCSICRGYLEERNGLLDEVATAFVLSLRAPWAIKWLEYHESDKNDDYENDLWRITGKKPFTSCGPGCCMDAMKRESQDLKFKYEYE